MTDNQVKGSRFWLVAPAACLCTADIGFTLMGQPTIYWAGNYNSANELNPIANFALHIGAGEYSIVICCEATSGFDPTTR